MDKLLKTFCGVDELRPAMMLPNLSSDGKYVVATNARVLIRMPVGRLNETYVNSPQYPDWEKIFPPESEWNLNEPVEIELLKTILSKFTPVPTYNECEVCNGEGDMECDMGHLHDCLACYGSGDGAMITGYEIDPLQNSVTINGIGFNPNFLARMIDICESCGTNSFIIKRALIQKAAIFEVEDIHLLIMPVLEPAKNKEKLL